MKKNNTKSTFRTVVIQSAGSQFRRSKLIRSLLCPAYPRSLRMRVLFKPPLPMAADAVAPPLDSSTLYCRNDVNLPIISQISFSFFSYLYFRSSNNR